MTKLKSAILLALAFILCLQFNGKADEGMWLPMHIKRLNFVDMQKMGLQLTAEEIYSINQACLKDAIVVLSGGSCTAEMVSKEGLVLTNHHCAFGVIQANSTVEHDYLTDGFWAMKKTDELPASGMTAGFLVRMEDVTKRVLAEVTDDMSEEERAKKIAEAIATIDEDATKDTHYNSHVRSFFEGNEYYLFVYETYKDVRLVGAPPSSVGKYGGDTDNWMWPRHTGDFAMLRVYTGDDGKPADYSESNKPYQPKYHLPVSLNGVKKNDYAMIMGYPGSTDRYLPSAGVNLAITKTQPATVKLRGVKLGLWKEDMNSSDAIRIKYASKYAGVANYWKYFQGQTAGLKRLKIYDKKKAEENAYLAWANKDPKRKAKYGEAISLIEDSYKELDNYAIARTYLNEAAFGSEIILFAWRASRLARVLEAGGKAPEPKQLNAVINAYKIRAERHFKDYNAPTDQKTTAALMKLYKEDVPASLQPDVFASIEKKYKNNFDKYAADMFSKSIFADEAKLDAFLIKPNLKVLKKDPAYIAAMSFINQYRADVAPKLREIYGQLGKGNRLYVAGLREMNPNKKYYPNANSTMRVTYGSVLDYFPRDAVYYNYFTTLDGVMEKEDPTNDEFIVPEKLKTLYKNKDYGRYGQDGKLNVCFLTTNDITGGNSGSPVINGNGELIGIAFDGNWEAMSGDIAFEPELQRTIVVDIRYVLFIIDKYAGASHLVDEMTLIQGKSNAKASSKMEKPDQEKSMLSN